MSIGKLGTLGDTWGGIGGGIRSGSRDCTWSGTWGGTGSGTRGSSRGGCRGGSRLLVVVFAQVVSTTATKGKVQKKLTNVSLYVCISAGSSEMFFILFFSPTVV